MAISINLSTGAMLCVLMFGQTQDRTLDDARIVQLIRAGVRPDEVGRIIQSASAVSFDLSPGATDALMKAGIGEDTIKLMAARANASAGAAPQQKTLAILTGNRPEMPPAAAMASVPRVSSVSVPLRGSRLFIAGMEGSLDGFIAPEIVKQKLPLNVVVAERRC